MPKYFIRKTPTQLQQEQNELLAKVVAKQTALEEQLANLPVAPNPLQPLYSARFGAISDHSQAESVVALEPFVDDEPAVFVPKVTADTASVTVKSDNQEGISADAVKKIKAAKK